MRNFPLTPLRVLISPLFVSTYRTSPKFPASCNPTGRCQICIKGEKKCQGLYLCRYNYAKPPSLSAHILMPLFISPQVYTWHQQGTEILYSRAGNGSCVFGAGARCDSAVFPWAAPVLLRFSPLLCRKSVTSLGRLFASWQIILAADLPLAQGFLSPSHPPLPSVPCVSEGSLRATVIMVCKKSPRVLPGRCFQRHRRALCMQLPWK